MSKPEVTLNSASVAETLALGHRLGQALQPGAVLALVGTLGSGKTHLVKGIAQGAEVPADVIVNSPTFVLVNEYPGRLPLFHIDAYRMHGSGELDALGFDEMLTSDGAVLVEWADRVWDCIPDDHLRIRIEVTGETSRRFALTACGPGAAAILAALA